METTLHNMFTLSVPVFEKILRPVVIYLALIVGLRLAGKRELAELNPFDLVVADHSYAGVASASGLEVAAFADLDAVALAVAAWQGRAVRVVPLDDRRPPPAYAVLLDLLEMLASAPVDLFGSVEMPAQTGS